MFGKQIGQNVDGCGHHIQTQNNVISHDIAIANVNLATMANVTATFNNMKKVI